MSAGALSRRAMLLCGLGAPLAAAQRRAFHIFDSHLHCPAVDGATWQWHQVTKSFAEFDAYLTRCRVSRGIINSVRAQLATDHAGIVAGNREAIRFAEQSKGKYLAACIVNPQFPDESLREMEECRRRYGVLWVGELCNYIRGYKYASPEFEAVAKQAATLRMVLCVHTELPEMEDIAARFPQTQIVFAHFGDDQEHRNIFRRIDTVSAHPNCYLDTSGYGHDRVGVLEYAVSKIGPDRILFGSDFSLNDPSTVIARIENAFLSDAGKQKILGGNLEALLAKVR